MAIYQVGGNRLGVPALTEVNQTIQMPLGTIVQGYDTVTEQVGEYQYVKFNGVATVGMPVLIDNTVECVVADADNDANDGTAIGIALTTTAANDYGFVQISGKAKVKAGTVAAGGSVFLTATAGTLDDAAVAGCQITGAKFSTADGTPAAGFAYAEINRPSLQTQDAVV